MAFVIKSDSFEGVNRFELLEGGVGHKSGVLAASTSIYPYAGISCVLLSTEGELSIQEGRNVAKVKLKLDNGKHQEFLSEMLHRIRQAQGLSAAAT